MNYYEQKINEIKYYFIKRRYYRLIKQIKVGIEIEKTDISLIINDYFKDAHFVWANHEIFPYLDNHLFEPTNKKNQYFNICFHFKITMLQQKSRVHLPFLVAVGFCVLSHYLLL